MKLEEWAHCFNCNRVLFYPMSASTMTITTPSTTTSNRLKLLFLFLFPIAIQFRSGLKPPGKKSAEVREDRKVVGKGKTVYMKKTKHDSASASASGIRYKYQEGFSAAVRRRVKIADLL